MEKVFLKNWTLQSERFGTFPASVPGDISADLHAHGAIPDPFYADNVLHCRGHLKQPFTYACTFALGREALSHAAAVLVLEGVDLFAEVYLNGALLGKTENMFLAYEFPCKELLREGENELRVRMLPVYDFQDANSPVKALFHGKGIALRKARCHFGWDWAPDFPGYGLWRPVYLRFEEETEIRDVYPVCTQSGKVTFITEWTGRAFEEGEPCGLTVEIEIYEGDALAARAEKELCALRDVTNLFLERPRLWQPNGSGSAFLYGYTVRIREGAQTLAERSGRFGIRAVHLAEEPLDQRKIGFALVVNGQTQFVRGSNWVPASNLSGSIPEDTYRTLIAAAKEAGYNMLRVWGGGIYEPDLFYDLCDEAGIMVMQDFMFSCSDVPDEDAAFLENVKKEAAYQLRRLRGHPCVTVWCGGNERCGGHTFLFKVLLRGLVGDAVRDAVYLYNSPCSWSSVEWDADTGDYHGSCFERALVEGDFLHFRRYIEEHRRQFLSECTMLGPSRLRSLKKFIPEEKLWPPNGLYDLHFVKNPYSPIKDKSFVDFEYCMGESLFGKITGLNDFVKKGMLAQAELMKAEAEYARSNPRCAGFMNWMFNDNWGCGTWAVIDYSFEKKPAYYAQKRAYAPLVCAFCETEEGVFAYVRNDSPQGAEGTFTVRFERYGGGVLYERKEALALGAGETARFFADVPAEECFGCCRFDGGAGCENVYHPHFLPQKQWQTALSVQVGAGRRHAGGYRTAVTLTANAFARAVFLDTANNEGVVFGDNYFDLPKGHTRTVEVDSPAPLAREDLCIRTIADSWDD